MSLFCQISMYYDLLGPGDVEIASPRRELFPQDAPGVSFNANRWKSLYTFPANTF